MKIVHCPKTTGGNPRGLCDAERRLGHDSTVIGLSPHLHDAQADAYIFRPGGHALSNEIRRWRFIFRILRRYSVIHFNAGSTLCPQRLVDSEGKYPPLLVWLYNNLYARWVEQLDLRLARLLGKVIAVTYQGSDARQEAFCRAHYPIHFYHETSPSPAGARSDRYKRERIARVDRYADMIYAVNPDIMHMLPARARFTPYASVNPHDWKAAPQGAEAPEIPHVIHAPSNRQIKGTKYILAAFARLQAEGVPFRYTLVEGIDHAAACRLYADADLLVDQLLAGYYGALSVELMALGKPVICYMREADFGFMPEAMRTEMPLIQATPDTLYAVLRHWLTAGRHALAERGRQSRRYVERWHDPDSIAAGIVADYQQALARRHGN